MSIGSISIEHYHMEHKGGTKDYDLFRMGSGDKVGGRNLVICRYGRVGNAGQMMVQRFDSALSAERFIEAKLKEKSRGGYGIVAKDYTVNDQAEVVRILTRSTWMRVGAANLNWLDNSFDTAGLSDNASAPAFDEDGNRADTSMSGSMAAEMQRRIAEAKEKEEQRIREESAAANAKALNWGMF